MRVANASPEREPIVAAFASAPIDRAAIEARLALERGGGWADEAALKAGLRRLRTIVVAALVDRDLDGRADLDEVVGATTALAEIAIGEAYRVLAADAVARHGEPRGAASGRAQDLLVVGMGKLGGAELNVSSDVDLVFVYAEDGETTGGVSNQEFFARLGRRLIGALADVTADGFVFRVDMRLRPDGDAGPLVAHFAMLEAYLIGSARAWERFAWVKARVVSPPVLADGAGATSALAELDALVAPFVYRRYLDFDAIDALRRLHEQIRSEAERRESVRTGRSARGADDGAPRVDVKLGRGGIREIEFVAQHHQLVRGGREPALRLRGTRETLAELARRALLDAETALRLRVAYDFLRDVEHRLQYLDDAQTHVVPPSSSADDRARVARMCARLVGVADDASAQAHEAAFVAALSRHRAFVDAQFQSAFAAVPSAVDAVDDAAWAFVFEGDPAALRSPASLARVGALLAAAGCDGPDDAGRLVAFASGARYRAAPTSTRARIASLVPRIVASLAGLADPSESLARWLDLVEAIVGRSAYLSLLEEYPGARANVTRLVDASPWAARYLARHPLLLDDLLAPRASSNAAVPSRDAAAWSAYWSVVAADLVRRLDAVAPDAERQMDLLRETHHAEAFRLLVDDLDGRLTVEALSDQLSALADLVLDATVRACWRHLRRDDWPREPVFAVIAFGKLGGKELGYASDLDLVFLYDETRDPGPDAVERHVRFARRLNVWLTARTGAGSLFDIDLRLRPDGEAGMVVSSLGAWSRYERRASDVGAWTWEHQALTRARFAAGDRALGRAFEDERVAILSTLVVDDAARARVAAEIVAMRRRMHDGHPNASGLFDLKHDPGGMVDVEFAVQYLVIAHGGAHRALLENVGNIALLGRAADAGLLDAGLARRAADAYRAFRARQHAVKLAAPDAKAARVPPDAHVVEREAVRALWNALFDDARE